MRMPALIVCLAALASTGAAQAARTFHLTYTTSVDATSGPARTVDAFLTTDDGQFYGAPGYQVTAATGTRGGVPLSFASGSFDDEIYFPGDDDGHFVDSFGLDLVAGGITYTLYRGPGDFAYHEFDGSTGRIVFDGDIALTPVMATTVPEPATWTLLVGGFGAVGASLRRRIAAAA